MNLFHFCVYKSNEIRQSAYSLLISVWREEEGSKVIPLAVVWVLREEAVGPAGSRSQSRVNLAALVWDP